MAVALTPDAFLSRVATTAWNDTGGEFFSYCGWRRIDVDRGGFTVLTYLGNAGIGGGMQFTADASRRLVVFRFASFADLLGGAGPIMPVGQWWFFGLTTIGPDVANNVNVYYAPQGAPSLTQVTASYPGQYQYTNHGVGWRPGTDGQGGDPFRLHGSAALDRTWQNTTLTPAEMLAEFQSETPVRTTGLWSAWPMADTASAGDDASGNARPLTANSGIGAIDTTEGPFDAGTGAVKLTPTAHYTRAGAPNGTDQTWCGWIRPDAAPPPSGYRTVISQDAGAEDTDWFSLNFDDTDGLELYVNNRAGPITTSGPVPTLGAWFFVGVVRSGTTWTFYWRAQDWVLLEDESGTGSGNIGTGLRLGTEFVVENAKTFEGAVAYWRVFETALTEAQLYQESLYSEAVLVEWADWPIAGIATQTDDISGNNRPLTADAGNGSFTDTTGPQVFGPEPVQGSGLLAGGGALDLAGTRSRTTDGSLAGGGALAISGTRASSGPFALDGAGSLSLAGAATTAGALSLAGGGALALVGSRSRLAAFALDGGGTLALDGAAVTSGALALDGGGALALSGARAKTAPFSLDGGGALTVAGTEAVTGSGTLDGGGALALSGTRSAASSFALDGGGALTVAGTDTIQGSGLLAGGGQLAMSGSRARAATAALPGGGGLTLAGIVTPHERGSGLLDAGGQFVMSATRAKAAGVDLDGGGALALAGREIPHEQGSGLLDGGGVLTMIGKRVVTSPCRWPFDPLCCEIPDAPPELIDQMTRAATETLWRASGWLYPACPAEVRPCLQRCAARWGLVGEGPWWPIGIGGRFLNIATCGCKSGCSCTQLCEVRLPGSPISAVTDVIVDGETLSPSAWRWDRPDRLLRTDGGCFPDCQDMTAASDQPGAFAVRYRIGREPDASANLAHSALICHLVHQCLPSGGCECRRTDEKDDDAVTGIKVVDDWIRSVNPTGTHGGPSIVVPGTRTPRVMTNAGP